MDNPPAGGAQGYLRRSLWEKDTDATWKNLFELAGDAAAASWKAAQLASVCCKKNRYVSRISVVFRVSD